MQAYGNLIQARQNFAYIAGRHAWKFGGEIRLNRDTTYFGTSPNGEYDFGGGTAYSPVEIRSQSGTHDVHAGDPLPDTLSALLTGKPLSHTTWLLRRLTFPAEITSVLRRSIATISRVYVQDTWKISRSLRAGLWAAL